VPCICSLHHRPPTHRVAYLSLTLPFILASCWSRWGNQLFQRRMLRNGDVSQYGAQTPGRPVEMDGSRFAKLCRECGVQGGKLNSIAIDIIFSKVKAKVRDRNRLGRLFSAVAVVP